MPLMYKTSNGLPLGKLDRIPDWIICILLIMSLAGMIGGIALLFWTMVF